METLRILEKENCNLRRDTREGKDIFAISKIFKKLEKLIIKFSIFAI